MYSFVHLYHGSLTCNYFSSLLQLPITSPLSTLGVFLILVLMLPWFNGVSYVYNIFSYVVGGCSGWVPMHFNEMNHLRYTLFSFYYFFRGNLPCLIDQLFKIWFFMPTIPLSLVVFLCVPPYLVKIKVLSTWSSSISVAVIQINNYF